MIRELIAPTYDAVSDPVPVPRNFNPGARVTIQATGLSGADEVQLWTRCTSSGSWEALRDYKDSGALVKITASTGPVTINNAAMRLGVTKTAGTGYLVGVYSVTQDLEGRSTDI